MYCPAPPLAPDEGRLTLTHSGSKFGPICKTGADFNPSPQFPSCPMLKLDSVNHTGPVTVLTLSIELDGTLDKLALELRFSAAADLLRVDHATVEVVLESDSSNTVAGLVLDTRLSAEPTIVLSVEVSFDSDVYTRICLEAANCSSCSGDAECTGFSTAFEQHLTHVKSN